jgi:O-antigen ligase
MDEMLFHRHSNPMDREFPDEPRTASGKWASLAVKIAIALFCVLASFALAKSVPMVTRIEPRIYRILGGTQLFYLLLALLAVAAMSYLLLRHAEVAVAIFYVIGFFKGDARLDSSPIDLTVGVAVLMIIGIALRLAFTNQQLRLPSAFLCYLPILLLMLLSLTYTPSLTAGLDKTLRFLFLTLLGAIAPFVLVDTPKKFRRFLATLVIGAILMSVNSFFMLGGEDRLVAPSGETTALGFSAGLALIVIWTLWFPRLTLPRRLLFYPIIGVLAVALVGSGGRLANVATAACIGLSILFCTRLVMDLGIIAGCGIALLPFVKIPAASLQYLASLTRPHDAFGTRTDLMQYGLQIFLDHPLFGVGIQGYRYFTPNPLTYNFPHNLLLELGAELGVFAIAAFVTLVFLSFRELFRLLRDSRFRDTSLERTLLALLVLGTLDVSVSGELNNDRLFFFLISMPFVLSVAKALYRARQPLEARPYSFSAQPLPPAGLVDRY